MLKGEINVPRKTSARPSAMYLAHFSSSCFSSRSMKVCRTVLAISPFPLPTKIKPSARVASEAISIETESSPARGKRRASKSSRCEPAYANPRPTIALVFSGTDLFSTYSPRRERAASASVRTPVLRIPVARSAPA